MKPNERYYQRSPRMPWTFHVAATVYIISFLIRSCTPEGNEVYFRDNFKKIRSQFRNDWNLYASDFVEQDSSVECDSETSSSMLLEPSSTYIISATRFLESSTQLHWLSYFYRSDGAQTNVVLRGADEDVLRIEHTVEYFFTPSDNIVVVKHGTGESDELRQSTGNWWHIHVAFLRETNEILVRCKDGDGQAIGEVSLSMTQRDHEIQSVRIERLTSGTGASYICAFEYGRCFPGYAFAHRTSACSKCSRGSYSTTGESCKPCLNNMSTAQEGATSKFDCLQGTSIFLDKFDTLKHWSTIDSVQRSTWSCGDNSGAMKITEALLTGDVEIAIHELEKPAHLYSLSFVYGDNWNLNNMINGGGIWLTDTRNRTILGMAVYDWKLLVDDGVEIDSRPLTQTGDFIWVQVQISVDWSNSVFYITLRDEETRELYDHGTWPMQPEHTNGTGVKYVKWNTFNPDDQTKEVRMTMSICTLEYDRCLGGYHYISKDETCATCPSGFYSSYGEKCKLCPAGRYSGTIRATACNLCPAGQGSNAGAADCEPCVAGKYGPGETSCKDCRPGEISHTGATECVFPTPTPTSTVTRTTTPSRTPTGTPSVSQTGTPSRTPTATSTVSTTKTPSSTITCSPSSSVSSSPTASVSPLSKIDRLDEDTVNGTYSEIHSLSIRALLRSAYSVSPTLDDSNSMYVLVQNATHAKRLSYNHQDQSNDKVVEYQSSLYRIHCEGGFHCKLENMQFQLLTQASSSNSWIGERFFRYHPMLWIDDVEDLVYLYGGWHIYTNGSMEERRDMWVWGPQIPTWSLVKRDAASATPPRRSSGVTWSYRKSSHTLHYVFGGTSSPSAFHDDLWIFELSAAGRVSWTAKVRNDGIRPSPRAFATVWQSSFNESLRYIFGGWGPKNKDAGSPQEMVEFGDLWEYDCENEIWTELWSPFAPFLSNPLHRHVYSIFVLKEYVLVIHVTEANRLWKFDLHSGEWSKLLVNLPSSDEEKFLAHNSIKHAIEDDDGLQLLQYRLDGSADISVMTLQV